MSLKFAYNKFVHSIVRRCWRTTISNRNKDSIRCHIDFERPNESKVGLLLFTLAQILYRTSQSFHLYTHTNTQLLIVTHDDTIKALIYLTSRILDMML